MSDESPEIPLYRGTVTVGALRVKQVHGRELEFYGDHPNLELDAEDARRLEPGSGGYLVVSAEDPFNMQFMPGPVFEALFTPIKETHE